MSRWKRTALLGALAMAIGLGAGAVCTPVRAQDLNYRTPTAVPVSWQRYAQLVQYRIGEWMRADDDVAQRFHVYLENRIINEPGPPRTLIVKVWVTRTGTVSRAEFPPLPDPQANTDLRAILERGVIGEAPPADMLQPLHLKIALKWKG